MEGKEIKLTLSVEEHDALSSEIGKIVRRYTAKKGMYHRTSEGYYHPETIPNSVRIFSDVESALKKIKTALN